MKRIFQILCVVFVFSSFIFSQLVFDSVTVSDQVSHQRTLLFGMDAAATDGIDLQFGEGSLPPFPPTGAFDARLYLPENGFSGIEASWKDFRFMDSIPFWGTKEFRLAYQPGTGSPGIRISWNFPANVTGVLQDILGGAIINVPMTGTNFFDVTPALDRLKMIITYDSTVAVELSSFLATVNGNSVVLNWRTASEINNRGFEVERKSLNSGWVNIGFVEGVGNSTSVVFYSFLDENVTGTSSKYRLKQLDFDGSFDYSKEVEVDLNVKDFNLYQNYPNPFNPATKISWQSPIDSWQTLKVYDVLGNEVAILVNEYKPAGSYKVEFNTQSNSSASGGLSGVKSLASGIYYYRLEIGSFAESKKMILLK